MKSFLFLFLIVLFTCCVSNKSKDNNNNQAYVKCINIDSLSENNPFVNNGELDSCKFVKLETNNDCLIGDVTKVIIKEGHIFIMDKNKKIFVFDINGKFQNTIAEIGPGPDELLSIIDFYVNENQKYVAVYDMYGSKIVKYSFEGKIISKIKCDSELLSNFTSITLIEDNRIALSMRNGENLKFNYKIINEKDFLLVKDCLPYLVDSISEYGSLIRTSISSNKGQCYASALFSDTIFKYDNDNFSPKYVFKSKLKKATSAYLNDHGPYESVIDPISYLNKGGYSRGISELLTTNDYLYFTIIIGEDYYEVFWNINADSGFYRLNYSSRNIFMSSAGFITTTSDAFVCLITCSRAIDSQQGDNAIKDKRIEKVMENISSEDNPIIGFYYMEN